MALTPVGGTLASNYNITYNNGGLTIGKATLTVNGVNTSVNYNGAAQTNGTATILGRQGSDDFTISGYGTGTNASTTAYADNLAVSPVTGTLASNYTITYNNGGLIIGKAALTVTGNLIYNGTTSISATSLTATGVAGQTFSITGSADLTSKNVQTNQNLADVNGLSLSPNGSALLSNYQPLSVTNTYISVTPLSVALAAPSINKVYDANYNYTMTAANLAALSAQLVGGDTVTSATVAFAGNNPNVGTNKTVNLLSATINDGNNGANYNVSLVSSNTSQITPAPLTITAVNSAKFVTQTDPAGYGGVIYNGFVNGETASVLTGSVSFSRSTTGTNAGVTTTGNSAGTYTLTPTGYGASGAVNGNYQITYQSGSFIIVPAQYLLVTVAPSTTTYGTSPTYTLTAQYLASNSSPITYLGGNGVTPSTSPIVLTTTGSNALVVNDGVGSTATFSITPVGTNLSGSGQVVVGGYNVISSNFSTTGSNFLGSAVVGSLTVHPMTLSATQLGIAGVSRVYNGSSSIVGVPLNTNPTLSAVLSGDNVSVSGTGYFDNPNVGVGKAITLNVSLTGADAANYALSSNQLTSNTGTITQLASVTYVGASGGNWSNASNWAGGAIPTLSNVANVVISTGLSVNYDSIAVGPMTSTITDNGTLAFNGANNFTFANNVSGTGGLNLTGAGLITLSGNNSFTGATNINASSLMVASANGLGAGTVTSSGGSLSVVTGVTLPNLTVNGPVNLATNIATTGAQAYNGTVTIAGGNAVSGVVTPLVLSTNNADITFAGALVAGTSGLTNKQSLTINAGTGNVTFGGQVGAAVTGKLYSEVWNNPVYMDSFYDLAVNAGNITIKGDITTFDAQIYNANSGLGHVYIGGNGPTDITRTLLSEDPTITFNALIDDTQTGTHTLVVKAISLVGNNVPVVTLNDAVGSTAALAGLIVKTGNQDNTSASPKFSDISTNSSQFAGNIVIASNVTTTGDQLYTANNIGVGNVNVTSTSVPNSVSMTSQNGNITYQIGTTGAINGLGAGAFLNAQAGRGGSVSGLNGQTVNQLGYGIVIPNSAPTKDAGFGAAYFTSEIKRDQQELPVIKTGQAVVDVGEAALVDGGKVRSFDDVICDPEKDPRCKAARHKP